MQYAGRKQIILGLIGVFFLVFLLYFKKQLSSILSVLAMATGFAVVLSPMCTRLEGIGICRAAASLISVLLLVVLAVLTFGILIPYITAQLLQLIKTSLPAWMPYFVHMAENAELFGAETIQWGNMSGFLTNKIGRAMIDAAQMGIVIVANIAKCAIALVIAYYLLCDRREIGRHLLLLIPISHRTSFATVLIGCRNAFLGYISGLVKTSMFVFASTYAGLLLLHIPDAFFLSLQMSLLEVLPYAGPVFAAIPILLSAASYGIIRVFCALILIVAIQQIEGNFVGPYFTASSTAVHPLAALAGIFVFGALFGIWGILLAVPVLTILQSIIWSLARIRANS